MKNYKELLIWKKGMDIWRCTYIFSKSLPKEEKYGLISQISRASASIPTNIAEGSSRRSEKDFYRFLEIALGSAYELETFIIGILELEIGDKKASEDILKMIDEEQKMLIAFMKKLNI